MRAIVSLLAALAFVSPIAGAEKLGSYIFSRGDHSNQVRIISHDWPVGIDMDDTFFWFSYGGHGYVIRDAKTLRSIDELFAPVHALEPQRREIRARIRPLERRTRDLERESRRWERQQDHGDSAEAESHIRDLERQISDIEAQIEKLEPEEEAIDEREEALEREAEVKMVPLVESAIRAGVARPN